MQVTFDYQPIGVHAPFHTSTAYERCMFGGYGSGKSFALCAEALAFGLEQPGSEILICRKTIPSLRDTTEAIFTSLIPAKLWAQCDTRRMGNHYESITLPNGTKYMFRGLDDWMKLKSLSVAGIFYDEVDEIDPETYEGLMSRVRQRIPTKEAKAQGAPEITRRVIVAASNPAGRNWVWKRFVSPTDKASAAEHFVSTSLDNPHLPISYIESLLDMPEPWIRRYVLCSFDEFAGQIYPDWSYQTGVIRPYPELPRDGMYIQGFDPGTAADNAAVWCYYDPQRAALVAVAEYAEKGLAATKHADAWRVIEGRLGIKVRRRIADPKAITVRDRGSNMGLDHQYSRLGFNFELGPNDPNTRIHSLGQLIATRRFFITDDCPRLNELLGNYRWEDLTPAARDKGKEAKPIKKDMDVVEALQYVASRYIAPPKIATPNVADDDWSAEIRGAIKKQIQRKRTATRSHDLGTMAL